MTKLAFEAHRFTRDQLKPLNDVVIVGEMIFAERFTNTGIVLLSDKVRVQVFAHAGDRYMLCDRNKKTSG